MSRAGGSKKWPQHGPRGGKRRASPGEQRLEQIFPNLKVDGYAIKSEEDTLYNCIAWALGETDVWWESVQRAGYYWPDEAPLDDRISSVVQVFKRRGVDECESDALDEGVDKVAIYGEDEDFLHVVRQTPEGRWTGKIGAWEDIEHNSFQGLVGAEYGTVVKSLRRTRR
jgi:hypothetical protein